MLTKEDIVETVGASVVLDSLEDLEILFLTIDEVGALEACPRLRRLTLLDNGIKRISNLSPVSLTLTVLCLCDQVSLHNELCDVAKGQWAGP